MCSHDCKILNCYRQFRLRQPPGNASQIPVAAEPLFLALNASVEFHPAMIAEDLMKAGPGIEDAVKKYS